MKGLHYLGFSLVVGAATFGCSAAGEDGSSSGTSSNDGDGTTRDEIPKQRPRSHGWQLVRVSHHHETSLGRKRLQQRRRQGDVDHGRLVHYQRSE